jgi:arginine/serine-rich splicing factor 12
MGTDDRLRVLQVYNISTAATNDLIKQLFQHFGRIDEFQVYPVLVTAQTTQKVAYVRYEKEKSVLVAQHLTNTVFFDRALICVPTTTNSIPDEETALLNSAALGKRVLPSHVTNKVEENEHGQKMLYTIDPNLTNLGLLPYPPLGADLDSEIVEQTRRTIYVGNLKKDVNPDDVVKFFNTIGEVMYLRMANINEHHSCAYAYVEFTNQTSIPQALQNDGVEFQGQSIRIQHSRVAIVKPQQKTEGQALEEIEEAMRRRDHGEPSPRRKATRSPSPRRDRSRRRSRTPPRRSRSRGRDRDRDSRKRDDRRDRDKDRNDRKDDRSSRKDDRDTRRDRERDKEKEKERRRSRSPKKEKDDKRDRDREKDKVVEEKSRDRDRQREKEKKEKEREKEKEVVKEKEVEVEKEKTREKDKEKSRDKDKHRDKDKKKDKDREKDREKDRRRSKSPRKDKERRRTRSKSPERKKKREEGKSKLRSRDEESADEKDKSKSRSRHHEKEKHENISDSDEPMPLAKEEMSLRERLLAKQQRKRHDSDEMEISD